MSKKNPMTFVDLQCIVILGVSANMLQVHWNILDVNIHDFGFIIISHRYFNYVEWVAYHMIAVQSINISINQLVSQSGD